MTHEENRLSQQKHERIARVKRVLRWMPRRSNVHRYPVLKWFARAARKRSYLWCFRVQKATPAIYAGCILSLLPLYGIQIPIAVALAFILRANLPIITSLQFITNPLTVIPAYYAGYQIGHAIMDMLGISTPALNMVEMKILFESIQAGNWGYNLKYVTTVWLLTALGGCVLGTFLGAIGSLAYRLTAYEAVELNTRLKNLQKKRQEAANSSKTNSPERSS